MTRGRCSSIARKESRQWLGKTQSERNHETRVVGLPMSLLLAGLQRVEYQLAF